MCGSCQSCDEAYVASEDFAPSFLPASFPFPSPPFPERRICGCTAGMSSPNVLGHIKLLTHCPISVKSDQDIKIASDAEPAPGQVKVSSASSPQLLVRPGFGWPLFARAALERYLRGD